MDNLVYEGKYNEFSLKEFIDYQEKLGIDSLISEAQMQLDEHISKTLK